MQLQKIFVNNTFAKQTLFFSSFRQTSPTREKRNSCPYAYGAVEDDVTLHVPVCDALPQFETEHVQPLSDSGRITCPRLYTPSTTSTRKVQIPFIR